MKKKRRSGEHFLNLKNVQTPINYFDLAAELEAPESRVRSRMTYLSSKLVVVIFDDNPSEIQGMKLVLESWPDMDAFYLRATPETYAASVEAMTNADIILLDERMGFITGQNVYSELMREGYDGVIASISVGYCPDWAMDQFVVKGLVISHRAVALNFVQFMNQLIRQSLESPSH
jgi:hypothetical protein